MSKLVEFVPNISEGRILSNIEYIANSIRTCEGVQLLNVSSDHDHNRTVFTIVGDLESIPLCTEKLYEAAISKIALRKHFGVHPRIGAVDVAPFIPLGETSMDECVALSEIIGAHIAEQFDLPVFLYANSATQPNRKKLADIRREGFEGLSKKLALPEWKPDFGTTIPHPTAGATVIGARFFLIAYNVVLNTGNRKMAAEIARSVRESSGGLQSVQALSLYLHKTQKMQISMNLLDYGITNIPTVYTKVESIAADYGFEILESELVGMTPRVALGGVDPKSLKISNFSEDLVLENFVDI